MISTQSNETEMNILGEQIIFKVAIAPRPACRPRFRNNGCVYNDPSYKTWLDDFSGLVRRVWLKDPLKHVSHISIVFNGETKRGDLDNYLKATLDGLVYAGVIKNDNLGVIDSMEINFIRTLLSDPWILIKINL
jgi:Holliday junction resolvase RusA-like endonuclease